MFSKNYHLNSKKTPSTKHFANFKLIPFHYVNDNYFEKFNLEQVSKVDVAITWLLANEIETNQVNEGSPTSI